MDERNQAAQWWKDAGIANFFCYVVFLSLGFQNSLKELAILSINEDRHSHVILIPFIVFYLSAIKCRNLPSIRDASKTGAAFLALAAAIILLIPQQVSSGKFSHDVLLAKSIGCYVLLLGSGGFLFLGYSWMNLLVFPFSLLVFMIPLPNTTCAALEELLMRASAAVADSLFQWAGIPVFRLGQIMELPGMTLEVAPQCSGIRSTIVLFITSLIAAHLFVSRLSHRVLLVAVVIPLGILRNALRVLVIGWLCVHYGPHMVDSWVHHHGGPLFFVISLIPLFLLAGWFRHCELLSEPR